MEDSAEVRDAVLAFYRGVTEGDLARFDELVSGDASTMVIGTAPGEWVTDRAGLRFGFEAEGVGVEAGANPQGHEQGSMGWFTDQPRFTLPDGSTFRTRLTAVLRFEDEAWKVVHMHWSSGVPDDEVVELQRRWGID